jgi:hypothetical protein
MSDATVCIVNDGQYCWGASWSDLQAAMTRLGWWTQDGEMWVAPTPLGEDEDAYTTLCKNVQPQAGYAPGDFPVDETGCAHLIYRPDLNGAWEYEGRSIRNTGPE